MNINDSTFNKKMKNEKCGRTGAEKMNVFRMNKVNV